jgi:hypothetical protein
MNRNIAVRRPFDRLLACPVHQVVLPKSLSCSQCGKTYRDPATVLEQKPAA